MKFAKPLPTALMKNYHDWHSTSYSKNKDKHVTLADEGQFPSAMVISCCDSRVMTTSFFGADEGDFFIHRNIANLVPTYAPDQSYHGTSAAIEYAVNSLKVQHVIVVGHSQCGGVAGCHAMCSGQAPELEEETSFVGRWVEILRPGYERVKSISDDPQEQIEALEKQSVVVSLENLMTFPFVKERVENGALTLHGASINIRSGELTQYDATSGEFVAV